MKGSRKQQSCVMIVAGMRGTNPIPLPWTIQYRKNPIGNCQAAQATNTTCAKGNLKVVERPLALLALFQAEVLRGMDPGYGVQPHLQLINYANHAGCI